MERAPTSASLCPGCGKPVDALRAGQVAILDGAFRYFHDASCKAAYIEVASKRHALDAHTADPPPVVSTEPSGVRSNDARSGVRAQKSAAALSPRPETARGLDAGTTAGASGSSSPVDGEREPYSARPAAVAVAALAEPVVDLGAAVADASDPPETGDRGDLADAADDDDVADDDAVEGAAAARENQQDTDAEPETIGGEPPAATLRSPAVTLGSDPAEPAKPPPLAFAPAVGIVSGVLAAGVSLAGEGAGAARVPLAIVATAVVGVEVVLRPREPSQPNPWGLAAPVVLATAIAIVARGEVYGAFAGLSAAGLLLVDLLVARARRDVLDARARTTAALATRARVARDGDVVEVDASNVRSGDQVVVDAGEIVPVDGVVASGSGEVAPWIDSPIVVDKREGDPVVAGASVVAGSVRVSATFTAADRAWLRLAEPAPDRVDVAAPLALLARRAAERGAPVAAALVAGATYASNGALADVALAACAGAYAAAALGAVGAVALAHARGHVAAQRRGIVYKDARAFDAAARVEVAVLCSRGTILLGEPEIVAIEAVSSKAGDSPDDDVARFLALAAGAELASNHPVAAAVLRAARARDVRPASVRSALKHSGLGVTALAPNGDKVIVGSRSFLLQEKVSVAVADARVSELEAEGRSVLLVAVGGRVAGLLALQDGLRPGARAAVQRLHDANVEPVLLSGEARETCETIARSLDIEHVRPEILPADRGAEVRALADGGHVVATVGHAPSDDGALGSADVSVAMGAAGAAPGEWSVTLASDDVRDAALALTIPRACRDRAIYAAVVGAAAQVLVALAIAFGIASPLIAPLAAVLAAAVALSMVREPTLSSPG